MGTNRRNPIKESETPTKMTSYIWGSSFDGTNTRGEGKQAWTGRAQCGSGRTRSDKNRGSGINCEFAYPGTGYNGGYGPKGIVRTSATIGLVYVQHVAPSLAAMQSLGNAVKAMPPPV